MMIIRCCKCGAWVGEKDDFKEGVRESHTYCNSCLHEVARGYFELIGKNGGNENG